MAGEQAQTHNPSKRDFVTFDAANDQEPHPASDEWLACIKTPGFLAALESVLK